MSNLDDQINSYLSPVKDNVDPLSDVLAMADFRAPPDMPSADGKFQNGRDLTLPPGTAHTVSAPPATAGSATATIDEQIELLHFGTAYLDAAGAFPCPNVVDDDPKLAMAELFGGHALMYRAALERETILLGGFIDAHVAALAERDDPKTGEGLLGQAMGVVGNLLGGGGGMASKATAADLNPYVAKVAPIAGALDVATITYDVTHQAGIDLHNLRASYQQYLQQEVAKPPIPTGEAGLFSQVPLLKSLLPPAIANIFTLVEKMTTKAFDVYVGLVVGLTQAMMPVIETASREITIYAITQKTAPIFSVWLPPTENKDDSASNLIDGPSKSTGTDPLSKLQNAVAGVVDPINQTVAPVIDFLSAPGQKALGSPFLDQIFDQIADGSGYLHYVKNAHGMGDIVEGVVAKQMGFPLPDFVSSLITRVAAVHADFLRGVYGKLCTFPADNDVTEDALVAAGRQQILSQLIEAVGQSVGVLKKIRDFNFNLNLFGPIEKTLSGEALYQRAKELVESDLEPYLDPIVAKVMKHFADTLEAARSTALAANAMTMEVYLARLPTLFALLFRMTFFPMWDLMVQTIFKPVTDLLDPMTNDLDGLRNKAQGIVHTVRHCLDSAKRLVDDALGQGLNVGIGGSNLGQYASDVADHIVDPTKPAAPDAAKIAFPFSSRKDTGSADPIALAKLSQIEMKWQQGGAETDLNAGNAPAAWKSPDDAAGASPSP